MSAPGQPATFHLQGHAFAQRDRLEIIREVYGRTILKADLDPLGMDPVALDLKLRALPGLGVATGNCSQFRVHHSASRSDSDDLVLLVALSGSGVMRHRGAEETVGNGSALVLSCAEAGLNVMQTGLRFVNLSFSLQHLQPLIGDLSQVLMRPLPANGPAMQLLVNYVTALQQIDDAPPELWQAAATHVMDLAALAIGATRDAAEIARGRGVRVARLRAIKADIAANAPHLSAPEIALRHGLSERYVRKLFAGEGASLSDFIVSQKLLRAHRMLSDPRQARRSITQIAFEAGFNDLSHFNRAFRRRYGATPTELRFAAMDRLRE